MSPNILLVEISNPPLFFIFPLSSFFLCPPASKTQFLSNIQNPLFQFSSSHIMYVSFLVNRENDVFSSANSLSHNGHFYFSLRQLIPFDVISFIIVLKLHNKVLPLPLALFSVLDQNMRVIVDTVITKFCPADTKQNFITYTL